MDRQVAMKWADRLESVVWAYDFGQLRVETPDGPCGSPMGVLADMLDPEGWAVGADGVSWYWHGEPIVLPAHWRRSVKMRTRYVPEFEDFYTHAEAASFVRENYQSI